MKQMIIVITALMASVGAFLLLARSSARKVCKPRMTLRELYEDNMCDGLDSLFD